MRNKFNQQLKELHLEIANMGGLCEEAISSSVQAFLKHDQDLAAQAQQIEAKIDRKNQEIENLCLRLLMLQTPVASDLRHVSTALHIINDMERIGDQSADIAELVPFISKAPDKVENAIHQMGEATVKMVSGAVQSFIDDDVSAAEMIIMDDDTVDAWFSVVKKDLIEEIIKPDLSEKTSETFVNLLMIDKYLERIGDHSVNIAEWVRWSIEGKLFENHE
ncbi:MAG: phosphate signaling complex protein PhoU [Oscillospiraceae bacterium]|nr:phosphate signaling complex protein PhoU [Oscillospiraceae bacterium]